jgi:hypothetical protein
VLTLATATAIALLSAAAGALAVSLGTERKAAPAAPAVVQPRLLVPAGAHAIAAVVDGKLWLTTRSGLRIEGLPVESAGLSPHAWYVAAGIGRSLIVMAPSGTRAWSQPTRGPVAAIAWAPSGLRIAYVVRAGRTFQLRLIEGDGDHDRLVDASVRPLRPAWHADSLAVAYVGAGGRPALYDLAHGTHRIVRTFPAPARPRDVGLPGHVRSVDVR